MSTHPDSTDPLQDLSIDTSKNKPTSQLYNTRLVRGQGKDNEHVSHPLPIRESVAAHSHARATPPLAIPASFENAAITDSPRSSNEHSYMEHYMRKRVPSISFADEVITDSGHRQSIDEPLEKIDKVRRLGGRSMMQTLADAQKPHRSHSESNRDQFDPVTGRHLPRYSKSPRMEEPHVGEARFPILQQTVDQMARESYTDLSQSMSLTTDSTMSPKDDDVHTPRDEHSAYAISPVDMPGRNISTSYESPRPFRRTASERWRNGETAADFFSQARSSRKGASSWRQMRRETTSSFKSPSSAASSYLRGFSMGSGGDESNAPSAIDAEGQTIGEDYVLGKQIGFGGFSIIREVTQLSPDTGKLRKLAVKIVRRNIEGKSENDNDAAQVEFEHEVELWRFLSHPHILPLEAVYKLDEATFCFIPLNIGGTLFDVVRNNRQGLSAEAARSYAYQISSALRYLHLDARVVHRDIKLENCLVEFAQGEPGNVRLCDFGMAEWLSSDNNDFSNTDRNVRNGDRPAQRFMGPAESSTAAFAGGSLEYAAPEIVRRATSDEEGNGTKAGRDIVSAAVDIWALGVCIFTLLMGKRPFSDTFSPRVVMAILAGEWNRDSVAEILSTHPEAEHILALLDGCLQMDERQRWQINDVIECRWFDDEREREEGSADDNTGRGWRL